MDTESMNAGPKSDPVPDATQSATTARVPDNIIPVEVEHPTTLGAPLARGAQYEHHFVAKLISDGRRLWALASAEGEKVLAEIRGEAAAVEDHAAAHKAAASAEKPAADPKAAP